MISAPLPRPFLRKVRQSDLPPAVVLGVGTAGLAIARTLARHGIPVLGIHTSRPRPAGYSGAWEIATYPGLLREDPTAYLIQAAQETGRRPVLFATHDLFVDLMARYAEVLRSFFLFELPEASALQLLRSKRLFAEEADRRGWPVPPTRFAHDPGSLDRSVETLAFPVIIKPAFGNLAFRTRSPRKAAICETHGELERAFAEFSEWESEMVIQEWIPGGDDDLYFSFHYHTAEHRELGRFVGRKIRQWPPLCGNGSLDVPSRNPELSESAASILVAAGCVGFGAVGYKRDPRNGRYYIIEPTVGRPNLQVGLAIANGVDLVTRAYAHLTGMAIPERPGPGKPRKWISFSDDLRSARQYWRSGNLTLVGYLQSIRGPKVFAVWDALDFRMYPSLLGGFVAFVFGVTLGLIKRLFRRRKTQ